MKNQRFVLAGLLILFAAPLGFFFWGVFYYWNVTCAASWHSGLLGASLGVAFTTLLALIAYYQLSNIAKTNSTDFIHRLKNDFFTEQTRILVDHVIEDRLIYKEISGTVPGEDVSGSSKIEMAYFAVDDKRILATFPAELREHLSEKKYYLEVEIDDFLLGPFEDIGLFEEKHLIDTDMAYEEFSYYVVETFENEGIKRYIGDPDFCEEEFASGRCENAEEAIRLAYDVISKDIRVGQRPTNYRPIDALNDFLKIPNLEQRIVKTKNSLKLCEQARFLSDKTWQAEEEKLLPPGWFRAKT